jgi:ubiquinone/menaquinone biosynthesis C-methylase UbiE
MSATLRFDEAASRRSEATYMTPDVVEQRRAVRAALALREGEKVLDIGSGAGLLAHEVAAEVGPAGSVDGVDPSESMLALARRRRPPDGAAEIRFVTGDACVLPFAEGSFDAAVATQVYEYVQDMPAALREASRVLQPARHAQSGSAQRDATVRMNPHAHNAARISAITGSSAPTTPATASTIPTTPMTPAPLPPTASQ